jgi:NADH dehydrogenase FAD-containing subunit
MSRGLKRVLILGGGFGGVYASRRLGPQVKGRTAEVTLVSRDNYFVMTPLLFEAASGVIEFRHAVNPIRPLMCCTDFVNATVERVDLAEREVHARSRAGDMYRLPYDHLVLALGGVTNTARTPGQRARPDVQDRPRRGPGAEPGDRSLRAGGRRGRPGPSAGAAHVRRDRRRAGRE